MPDPGRGALYQRHNVGDPCNLVLLLVHLQGVHAIFSVGRHHHRGPFYESRGLTHALIDTIPTYFTSLSSTPSGCERLSARPRFDRIMRLPCGRLALGPLYMFILDACERTCRS